MSLRAGARAARARACGRTYKGPPGVAGSREGRGHGSPRPQAAPRDPAARGLAEMRGALTLSSALHLLLPPQAILAPLWTQIPKARDGLVRRSAPGEWRISRSPSPRAPWDGEAFREKRDRETKRGGGIGGHSSTKVTSESHSCPLQGESGPSSASARTLHCLPS